MVATRRTPHFAGKREPRIECNKMWGSCSCHTYVCVLSTAAGAIVKPLFKNKCFKAKKRQE
jgi:hypothetical protein